MITFPYLRLAYLFDVIQQETLPQTELAKRFSVSNRTIRNDMIALNEILESFGANIINDRKNGYEITISDSDNFARLLTQKQQTSSFPRTVKERSKALVLCFLTQSSPLKLDDIADEWFVSRSTLQQDMVEVKEYFNKYQLQLEKHSRYGLKLAGEESSIRTSITDMLWQLFLEGNERAVNSLKQELFTNIDLKYLEKVVHAVFDRFKIKVTYESFQYLVFNCAVSIMRITSSHNIIDYDFPEQENELIEATQEILATGYHPFLKCEPAQAELHYLQVQIAARRICLKQEPLSQDLNSTAVVDNILEYINNFYNYDLLSDERLRRDLEVHVAAMIIRMQHHLHTSNPLLDETKKYYPFAYDVILSAMRNLEKKIGYSFSEDEMGYLAIHIGVGLERNYNAGYERHPQVLIVTNSANSTVRMIETHLFRQFPQIHITNIISLPEYNKLPHIDEDFIITTVTLSEKNRPIVKIAPFPTSYQMEQIGHLALLDRTKPYILEKFFSEKHFMYVDKKMTQQELFKYVYQQLFNEKLVTEAFYDSLIERESIVSTFLGEGIAIPHTLGLIAKKTAVVTILVPKGIAWGNRNEMAYVIFLLAISKEDYEEAMPIYDLFVTFVREKATKRLLNSKGFSDFKMIAKDSLGRSA